LVWGAGERITTNSNCQIVQKQAECPSQATHKSIETQSAADEKIELKGNMQVRHTCCRNQLVAGLLEL